VTGEIEMRGTELTEQQIQSARQFLSDRRVSFPGKIPLDEQIIKIPFGDVARIVAWCGALRYIAGRDGSGGTLEEPGLFVEIKA
jgi:hypothetical protein